jgi:hypothetical protein
MKCRACWTDKAYERPATTWREIAMTWLGFVPLKCQHCYHKFSVLRVLTIGQQLTPVPRKTALPPPTVLAFPQAQREAVAPQRVRKAA